MTPSPVPYVSRVVRLPGMMSYTVPAAVAAITSLAQLRCLELYGSSIDRVLDPPYRLLGLTALRNLTRLRIDLPAENPDGFRSGAGVVAAAAAAPEAGFRAGDVGGGGGGGSGWCLGPTLAALSWLQDLDLGVSYALPPEALPALAPLTQLTQLRCATLLTPPPQHRHVLQPQPNLVRQQPTHRLPGLSHQQQPEVYDQQQQEEEQQQQQQWPFLQLPLPASLEELQVATLPAVPVLAALAALPRLRALTLARRDTGAAAAANPAAAAASAAAGSAGVPSAPPPLLRTSGCDEARVGSGGGAAQDVGAAAAGPLKTSAAAAAAGAAAAATAVAVTEAPGGPRNALVRVPRTTSAVIVAPTIDHRSDDGDGDSADFTGILRSAVVISDAAAAAASAAAGAMPAAAAAASEPLRLILVGEEFAHEHRSLAAASCNPEEVAVAARLLRRLLPPPALRRLALQPFARSPAAMLEGPHAGWLSELVPLAGAVEAVEMAALVLEPGDLDSLRGALPELKVLSLYVCRLDADAVRRLRDEQPSLALRVDASCEYAGMYGGGSAYDNEYGAADGCSEEFVDEAEIQDPDFADLHGIWPVAAELQRAYERALDATDDEDDEGQGGEDEGEEGGEIAEGAEEGDGGGEGEGEGEAIDVGGGEEL